MIYGGQAAEFERADNTERAVRRAVKQAISDVLSELDGTILHMDVCDADGSVSHVKVHLNRPLPTEEPS